MSSWVPQPKIAVAGSAGPVFTTVLTAWLFPDLDPAVVAALASLLTAVIGYIFPVRRRSDPTLRESPDPA